MSLPYFPMYPTDFEADTSHLTLAEDGAYNRILRLMWMTPGCSLPDDDAWIMRRMRCVTDADCQVVADIIAEFFKRKGGRVVSPRLAKEYQKTDLAHKKRVAAGSKGGKAKASQLNNNMPSNATAKPKQPEPEPEPDIKKEDTNVSLVFSNSKRHKGFDEFWERYPRKVSKPNAQKAYARAVKSHGHDEIMFGLSQHLADLEAKEKRFIPHAATWLNGERFKDEPEQSNNSAGQQRITGGASPQRIDPALNNALRLAGIGAASGNTGD